MSKSCSAADAYGGFLLDQLQFAALGYLRQYVMAGMFGNGLDLLINEHCVFHGTPGDNAAKILQHGFKESSGGMLGQGVYGAHDFQKAKGFAGKDGTVLVVTFYDSTVQLTCAPDIAGSWRAHHQSTYCNRPVGKTEMCFKKEAITGVAEAKGLNRATKMKIDEFFLKHPKLRNATVFLGATVEVAAKIHTAAQVGAGIGVAISALIDKVLDKSTKVTREQIEQAFAEATAVGALAGAGVASVAAGIAASAETTVAASGVWGMLGYTTTTAAYSAAQVVGIATGVGVPIAFAAAAVYAVCRLQSGQSRPHSDSK